MTYDCPLCHLRFHYSSELESHARDDHLPHDAVEMVDHITRYRDERPPTRFVTPSM